MSPQNTEHAKLWKNGESSLRKKMANTQTNVKLVYKFIVTFFLSLC